LTLVWYDAGKEGEIERRGQRQAGKEGGREGDREKKEKREKNTRWATRRTDTIHGRDAQPLHV
jgi:hypothetical protein